MRIFVGGFGVQDNGGDNGLGALHAAARDGDARLVSHRGARTLPSCHNLGGIVRPSALFQHRPQAVTLKNGGGGRVVPGMGRLSDISEWRFLPVAPAVFLIR